MKKTVNNSSVLKRLMHYLGRYSVYAVLSLVFALIYVASTLLIPIICGDAIDLMLGKGNVDLDGVFKMAVAIGAVAVIGGIFFYLLTICNNKIVYSVVRDVRRDAMHGIQNVHISYIDSKKHGDIVSRIINDTDRMADGLLLGFSNMFVGVITIIGTLAFMLSINIPISLIVIVCTPISLFTARFIAKSIHHLFGEQAKVSGEQTAYIDEMINNRDVVIASANYTEVIEKFDTVNESLRQKAKKAVFFSSLTNPITRFVNSLVYMGVGIGGAILCIQNPLFTVGKLSVFLSYANKYTKPFNEISEVIPELQNALACASRVLEIIDLPAEEECHDNDGCEIDGSISFTDVEFSYSPDKKLIKDFNLDVAPGSRIAIVGPTGCGKTTLINLIMRFYDPISGKISISDKDTRTMSRTYLRKNIGMVLQDTAILEGTVREVIAYGKPDATDEEIKNAAKLANAHSFIKRLPNGYDTKISSDSGISYGQRQLLCIARVMLLLPPMLILDEATSSIDVLTESRIQKAFSTLMKGRTSFVVAHRLSTIKESDLILVMKDGDVIEQGKHDELLMRDGFYAQLWHAGI